MSFISKSVDSILQIFKLQEKWRCFQAEFSNNIFLWICDGYVKETFWVSRFLVLTARDWKFDLAHLVHFRHAGHQKEQPIFINVELNKRTPIFLSNLTEIEDKMTFL